MANGFKPTKAKARQFSYKPRYYNSQQEEREQRREELTGRRLDLDMSDNKPGDLLRRQITARRGSRVERKGMSSILFLVFGLVLLIFIAANLVPMWEGWFGGDDNSARPTQQQTEIEEFNPYAPITVVPNDYQE